MTIDFGYVTQKHIVTGLNWISKMSRSEYWNLTADETAALLGVDLQTYKNFLFRLHRGEPIDLSVVAIERLSLLLGVWKHLQLWAPAGRQDIAISTFNRTTSIPELDGMSIKHYLLQSDSADAFDKVKRFLSCQ
jgi:hypothetical protein